MAQPSTEIYVQDNNPPKKPSIVTDSQSQPNPEKDQPIYILTLEVDKGSKKNIYIYSDSNPGELAFDFCKKNNLNFDSLKKLQTQIEELMKQFSIEVDSSEHRRQIPRIPKKEKSHHVLSKNYSVTHKDKHVKPSGKLFPYEFTITDNRNKNNSKPRKRTRSYCKNGKHTTTLTSDQSLRSLQPKKIVSTSIPNGITLSRIPTSNSINKSQKDIFERLFKDSQIKRIAYRRPCHFSTTSPSENPNTHMKCESSINNTNLSINSFYLYNNGLTAEDAYARSYMLRNSQKLNENCTFKPNISPVKASTANQRIYKMFNVSGYNTSEDTNNPTMQGLFKGNRVKTPSSNNYSHSGNNNTSDNLFRFSNTNHPNSIYNVQNMNNNSNNQTISILNNSSKKNGIRTISRDFSSYNTINANSNLEIYRPLRERLIRTSREENAYLEAVRIEAFINLYNELIGNSHLLNGNDNNVELNKDNLTLERVPDRIKRSIQTIVDNVMKGNNYTQEKFVEAMKEVFGFLTFEEKRYFIDCYKKNYVMSRNICNESGIEKNKGKKSPFLFNSNTSKRNHSLNARSQSREHIRDFYRKEKNEKKRNFYYVFN